MQVEPFLKYSLLHLTSVMTALTSSWFQAIKRVAHYCVFQRRSSMVRFQMASFPWEASLKDNLVSTALNQSDQGHGSGSVFFLQQSLTCGKSIIVNDEEPIQNREKLVTLREDTVQFREDAVHLREDAAVSREQIICTADTEREASDGHLVFVREANAQLVISGIEAGRASQLKDEFLAMISHELKTPLSVILGWSQLILGGKLEQDDIRKGMQAIERSARAQNKLIEDLLEMSSMISGKVRLDMQQLDIVSLVGATVESMRPTAETKRIILQETTDREAGWISGDANRMQQVFWNLLSNAIKFTPADGRIEIGMKQSGSFFEIRIDDSGLGISADFLPYVFERFLQADTSLARQYKGVGLGLAIVKQLVELHGGMVRAESAGINKGASFIVQLPLLPLLP